MFEGVGLQVPLVLLGSLAFSLIVLLGLPLVWFGAVFANVTDCLAIVTSTGFGCWCFVRSTHSIKIRFLGFCITTSTGAIGGIFILFFVAFVIVSRFGTDVPFAALAGGVALHPSLKRPKVR